MAQMTLKRLMELSGVDMNSPKVTTLLEADQRVTELVKRIEDDMREIATDRTHSDEIQHPEAASDFEYPDWRNGSDLLKDVMSEPSTMTDAIDALEVLIGHEKTQQLIVDIANQVFDETEHEFNSPPPKPWDLM